MTPVTHSPIQGNDSMSRVKMSQASPPFTEFRKLVPVLKKFDEIRETMSTNKDLPLIDVKILTYIAAYPGAGVEDLLNAFGGIGCSKQNIGAKLGRYGTWEGAKDQTTGEPGLGYVDRYVDDQDSKIKYYELSHKGRRFFEGLSEVLKSGKG